MTEGIRWRLASDYIGAGSFVVTRDRVAVGTEYGLQSKPLGGAASGGWEAHLGSRCLGVVEGRDRTLFATCVGGFHAVSAEGREVWGVHSLREIVCFPIVLPGGVVFTSRNAIHCAREWGGAGWRFDFSSILGRSVDAVRVVNLFAMGNYLVGGVVDYDTGIGRVLVLHSRSGGRVWMSDPGPISEVFPGGRGVFIWCQTGYGSFETRMTRLDGHEVWAKEGAGVGCARHDGSIAMLIGSNESPTWDDWEYRQLSPGGKLERRICAKGCVISRPVCLEDGTVFFMGTTTPPDPSGYRAGDTRFFRVAQEVLFQHLMGIKLQAPIYDIHLHRLAPDGESTEVRYQRSRTFSLGELQRVGDEIVFCDGTDILAVGV